MLHLAMGEWSQYASLGGLGGHQRPSVQLDANVCTAQLGGLWEGLQPQEGYSVEIAVISKAHASIIRKDTCKESLTKVMKGIICRISMTPHENILWIPDHSSPTNDVPSWSTQSLWSAFTLCTARCHSAVHWEALPSIGAAWMGSEQKSSHKDYSQIDLPASHHYIFRCRIFLW